eukprot:Sspe_Gene.96335::Locus_68972_Transcript_1_1_Confidence_1.000_Length_1782::g.96335::m.96335
MTSSPSRAVKKHMISQNHHSAVENTPGTPRRRNSTTLLGARLTRSSTPGHVSGSYGRRNHSHAMHTAARVHHVKTCARAAPSNPIRGTKITRYKGWARAPIRHIPTKGHTTCCVDMNRRETSKRVQEGMHSTYRRRNPPARCATLGGTPNPFRTHSAASQKGRRRDRTAMQMKKQRMARWPTSAFRPAPRACGARVSMALIIPVRTAMPTRFPDRLERENAAKAVVPRVCPTYTAVTIHISNCSTCSSTVGAASLVARMASPIRVSSGPCRMALSSTWYSSSSRTMQWAGSSWSTMEWEGVSDGFPPQRVGRVVQGGALEWRWLVWVVNEVQRLL